ATERAAGRHHAVHPTRRVRACRPHAPGAGRAAQPHARGVSRRGKPDRGGAPGGREQRDRADRRPRSGRARVLRRLLRAERELAGVAARARDGGV
ncbi:MAG: hypothetical protein AVDCRST_MAG40-2314, partial [uncultured Gemmatimonadaceae bacterium]